MSETLTKDLSTASAGELARAVATGQVSAVELTEAAIGRIESRDKAINAVVVRDFDRALVQAKAADAARSRGKAKLLLGVPMTVKESHNIAGLRTTWGSEVFGDWVAPKDSVGVARLKAAGAVILGKTNIPPFLSDWQSANPIYGRTVNPYDHGRSPGGSSGGGAAALAAGMIPLEFGSDIGGSIRIPASFCGVFGHKPTHDLIPSRGHSPPGVDGNGIELAVVGPLARTASDLELALDVLAGPTDEMAIAYRLDLPKARHAKLADFRVLVLDGHPLAPLDDEVRDAIRGLAVRLDDARCEVSHESELLPDLARLHELYMAMLGVAMTRGGPPPENPMAAHAWMDLKDGQIHWIRMWRRLFQDFDVVVAPAFSTPAFPHDTNEQRHERFLTVNGQPTPYFTQLAWAGLATFPNLPSTAAPIGMSKGGLPIGVQIIGSYMEDRTTLAFARLMEEAFGGFRPPGG